MAQELRQAGWKKARALVGGFDAWQEAGLPVEPKQEEQEEDHKDTKAQRI